MATPSNGGMSDEATKHFDVTYSSELVNGSMAAPSNGGISDEATEHYDVTYLSELVNGSMAAPSNGGISDEATEHFDATYLSELVNGSMAAPSNGGISDEATEHFDATYLSELVNGSMAAPSNGGISDEAIEHFDVTYLSELVTGSMAEPSNNGISNEAIEDFDETIFFNFPPSPLHIRTLSPPRPVLPRTLSPPRPVLPSSNSMVSQPMEIPPQIEQQEDNLGPYGFFQLLKQQSQWMNLLLALLAPMLLRLPLMHLQGLLQGVLQLLAPMLLRLPPMHLQGLLQWLLQELHQPLVFSLLELQLLQVLELHGLRQVKKQQKWILSLPSHMQEPLLQQWVLSLSDLTRGTLQQILPSLSEATVDDEVGIGGVGTGGGEREKGEKENVQLSSGWLGKRKKTAKTPEGERGSKKTTGGRIAIPLEGIPQTKDAAMNLNVSRSTQLNPDPVPSDQALAAKIDINSVVVKEIVPPLFLPTARQGNLDEDFGNGVEAVGMGSERTGERETEDGHLNTRDLGKGKRMKMTPRGERRNKKTTGVRIEIPLEDILQTKEMLLIDAAKHLKVSIAKLKSSCREYGIHRWPPRNEHKFIRQSLPNETPAVVGQKGIPQLSSHTVPSTQALMATVDTNSFFEKEILPPQFLPTAQQDNPDAGLGNDEDEAIGTGVEGTGDGVIVEAQLNSGCLGKGKFKEKSPGGKRGNKGTTGVRIAIAKEDILQTKRMRLKDAAKHLQVSRSTFKRVCREYNIYRWPPRKEHELIGQSRPNESPTVVDQEQIPQLNSDTLLPSNQVSATIDTNSVKVKVRCEEGTTMFRLSCPWLKEELEQVKKRLSFEVGTYNIGQSRPNESPAVVDQEQIPQLNSDTLLPSNEVSATTDTNSVKVKVRCEEGTIMFRLSCPWRKEELEQQVKKRLSFEAGTYNINYKDEDDDLMLIKCDEDLEECISSSSRLGTRSIELFLIPK
ncbi:uncharacterized protein LOC131315518 [Rhododendron vialii]|uniref:uncharacterized protein LOC131315518 n=1 Tax=Rhododendron vialii TaxID=182163 RepID=UPI00265F66A1|nr:uncharacterized protein LOC131315518 [Rhododendron vialii]